MLFDAIEFDNEDIQPTGTVETYGADTFEQAVAAVLYAHRLHDGNARLGPTGRVIYCGARSYYVQAQPAQHCRRCERTHAPTWGPCHA